MSRVTSTFRAINCSPKIAGDLNSGVMRVGIASPSGLFSRGEGGNSKPLVPYGQPDAVRL